MKPKDLWFRGNEWDYNWNEVFGYCGGPNADGNSSGSIPEAAPLGADVPTTTFGLDDVEEIYAYIDGEHDERDWVCYGLLKDGRYFSVRAGCDYTGWDCQASGMSSVAKTKEDIERFGLGVEERVILGVKINRGEK